MAVIPALGEELLFRGVIQRLFGELTQNRHTSIILTAVLFSALHMQFFGFVPRFMLGVAFGYLLLWSGNLWLPILAHFVNNAGAVVLSWLAAKGELPFDPNQIGSGASDGVVLLISVIATSVVFYLIRSKSNPAEENLTT
jgi:membrane protease YdiL (CAAX protease family)